jgi:hypothetical protein
MLFSNFFLFADSDIEEAEKSPPAPPKLLTPRSFARQSPPKPRNYHEKTVGEFIFLYFN